MDEKRTELANYCRSLLKWAEENQGSIPRFVLVDLLSLVGRLLDCA